MTTVEIQALKSKGLSMQTVTELVYGNSNLFCIAFFGWKATKTQRALLNRLRHRINQVFSTN